MTDLALEFMSKVWTLKWIRLLFFFFFFDNFLYYLLLWRYNRPRTDRRMDKKEMAVPPLRQNYSLFPGFIWQEPSSQLLLRWKLNSQRSTRTKVIQTAAETLSGKSGHAGQLWWVWGGSNNFNLSSFSAAVRTRTPWFNISTNHRRFDALLLKKQWNEESVLETFYWIWLTFNLSYDFFIAL